MVKLVFKTEEKKMIYCTNCGEILDKDEEEVKPVLCGTCQAEKAISEGEQELNRRLDELEERE